MGLPRNEILAICIGLLLGVAGAAAFFSEPSDCFRLGEVKTNQEKNVDQHIPKKETDFAAPSERQPSKEPHECKTYWGPEWSLVWVTIILVLVTSGLAWFTAFLYWTTKRLADEAQKSSEKQN